MGIPKTSIRNCLELSPRIILSGCAAPRHAHRLWGCTESRKQRPALVIKRKRYRSELESRPLLVVFVSIFKCAKANGPISSSPPTLVPWAGISYQPTPFFEIDEREDDDSMSVVRDMLSE